MISPPQIVLVTTPRNCRPWYGWFFDLDANLVLSTVKTLSGSMIVMSAMHPWLNVPPRMPKMFAGLVDINLTNCKGAIAPVWYKCVNASGTAVSSPIIPFGGLSDAFSCAVCGAWSVAIASMVPSANPRIIACLSFSVASGGAIFAFTPHSAQSF